MFHDILRIDVASADNLVLPIKEFQVIKALVFLQKPLQNPSNPHPWNYLHNLQQAQIECRKRVKEGLIFDMAIVARDERSRCPGDVLGCSSYYGG